MVVVVGSEASIMSHCSAAISAAISTGEMQLPADRNVSVSHLAEILKHWEVAGTHTMRSDLRDKISSEIRSDLRDKIRSQR